MPNRTSPDRVLSKHFNALLRMVHHLEANSHDRPLPKAYQKKIRDLSQFIRPARPNPELQEDLGKLAMNWGSEVTERLRTHYKGELETLRTSIAGRIREGNLTHTQIDTAAHVALIWGKSRIGKKLLPGTIREYERQVLNIQTPSTPGTPEPNGQTPQGTRVSTTPQGSTGTRSTPESIGEPETATPKIGNPTGPPRDQGNPTRNPIHSVPPYIPPHRRQEGRIPSSDPGRYPDTHRHQGHPQSPPISISSSEGSPQSPPSRSPDTRSPPNGNRDTTRRPGTHTPNSTGGPPGKNKPQDSQGSTSHHTPTQRPGRGIPAPRRLTRVNSPQRFTPPLTRSRINKPRPPPPSGDPRAQSQTTPAGIHSHRQPSRAAKMANWELHLRGKPDNLIIGTSNLARITKVPRENTEIHAFHGGKFEHLVSVLHKALPDPNPKRVLLAMGINDASSKTPIETIVRDAQTAANLAKIKFPGAQIHMAETTFGHLLPTHTQARANRINQGLQKVNGVKIIPALSPQAVQTVDKPHIHWSSNTANTILAYWTGALN